MTDVGSYACKRQGSPQGFRDIIAGLLGPAKRTGHRIGIRRVQHFGDRPVQPVAKSPLSDNPILKVMEPLKLMDIRHGWAMTLVDREMAAR